MIERHIIYFSECCNQSEDSGPLIEWVFHTEGGWRPVWAMVWQGH